MLQDGLPPYRMRCPLCRADWLPEPRKDGTMPESRLQRLAEAHFKQCPGRVVDMAAAPSGSEPGAAGSD